MMRQGSFEFVLHGASYLWKHYWVDFSCALGILRKNQKFAVPIFYFLSLLRCCCSTAQNFNVHLLSRNTPFCSLFSFFFSVRDWFSLHSLPLYNLNAGNFPKSSWCLVEMLKTIFIVSHSSGCQTYFLLLYFINKDTCMKTGFFEDWVLGLFFCWREHLLPLQILHLKS